MQEIPGFYQHFNRNIVTANHSTFLLGVTYLNNPLPSLCQFLKIHIALLPGWSAIQNWINLILIRTDRMMEVDFES